MRPLPILFLCLTATFADAQNADITPYSQNIALADTDKTRYDGPAPANMITETYQIPAYDMYSRYWDIEHLRSRTLDIPFSDNRLMLLLVQSSNHPFAMPCMYDEIALHYGPTKKGDFHTGIDLVVESQTLVKCCFDGVVRMAKHYGDYGNMVVVRHYNGLETVYARLGKYSVRPGQAVNAGDIIGRAGETATTDHGRHPQNPVVHFELRLMNEYFDPELAIDFENENIIKNTLVLKPEDFTFTPPNDLGGYGAQAPESDPAAPAPAVTGNAAANPTGQESSDNHPQSGTRPNTGNATTTAQTELPPGRPENEAQEATAREAATPAGQSAEKPVYHIVKKGETLYRIALNHHISVERLTRLNNIQNVDHIQEGRRLRVR